MYLMGLVYGAAVWGIIMFIVSIVSSMIGKQGYVHVHAVWTTVFVCMLLGQVIWAYLLQ